MGTGLIYAAIVAAWAVYLVPLWLRRNDEAQATRAGDTIPETARLVRSRRTAAENGSRLEAGDGHGECADDGPKTSQVRRSGRDRGAAPAEGTAGSESRRADRRAVATAQSGASEQAAAASMTRAEPMRAHASTRAQCEPAGTGRQRTGAVTAGAGSDAAMESSDDIALDHVDDLRGVRSARPAAARRGRVLLLLVLATTLVAGLAVVNVLPGWSLAIPGGLLVGFALLSAMLGRRERRIRCARYDRAQDRRTTHERVPAGRAAGDDGAQHFGGPIQASAETGGGGGARLNTPTDQTDHGQPADTADRVQARRRAANANAVAEVWDPVSVPLPTYVTKAKAPRTVRTIDLSEPATYSAGRGTDASIGSNDAAMPHGQPGQYEQTGGPGAISSDGTSRDAAREQARDDLFDQEQVRPAVGD